MTLLLLLLGGAAPASATPAESPAPREIARSDGANLQRPSWSPAGDQLSWEANFHDRKEIALFVGRFDGAPAGTPVAAQRVTLPATATSPLTAGFTQARGSGGVAHELSWAPPSIGRYVFSAVNEAQDFDLYLSGGSALAPAPGADGGAAWSPDGRHVVFTSARSGEGDLYLLDVHEIEGPPRRLTRTPTASEVYPAWAPTSDRIAFVGHSPLGDNLWLLPALDASPVRLTAWPGNQVRPRFSPDGAWVAFYANREDPERFDLYVMPPVEGADARRIASGVVPDARGPAFTPDSRELVVVLDRDDAFDPLARVPVAGGEPRVLDLGTVGHGDLDLVHRDGTTWIAYVAQGRERDLDRGFKRLYVAALPAAGSRAP